MTTLIKSSSNSKVKWLKSLHKNSIRRSEGVFVVEGIKEIASALDNNYIPHSFFICPELYGENIPESIMDNFSAITKDIFEKVSYRSGSDGMIAVFMSKQKTLAELNFPDNPFFIIVEAIEKPGNLGAIIRTADGAGADGVIICNENTDLFNPNVIRSSVGTIFNKQIVSASNEDVFDFLQNHEITPFGAIITETALPYFRADFTRPTAIILGTEHDGLSSFWQQRATPIIIPMLGQNDSLNVSAASAVVSYEVLRQRIINKHSLER
ncbi:RNA methyltransferase [Candidatus Saccharibacteria bacterium]|jgi:TrmH family RNA methyltransferase|nr:RNA methyltransferase [Candidatus Saccharibacteria bacterium]